MKTKIQHKMSLAALLLLCTTFDAGAQTEYSLKSATIVVEGTSTMHDWDMKAEKATGKAVFAISGSTLSAINELQFTLVAEDLTSHESSIMDKNAYKALKTSDYKTIVFQVKQPVKLSASGKTFVLTGKLQIAGVTKDVRLTVSQIAEKNDLLVFKGECEFKMSDFNVEAPTFMFGAMKTGDEVEIEFEVSFSKSSIVSTK